MNNKDTETIKQAMSGKGWKFLNLYKHGVEPYWTAHTTPEIAELEAREGVLHIALPVHEDWFNQQAGQL
jgi:hypothetical protein